MCFVGEVKILNLQNYDVKPVTFNCYLQWQHMKSYATENIMPILSENGNYVAFPVELAVNEINEDIWKFPGGSAKNEEILLKKAALPLKNPSTSHDIRHASTKYLKRNVLYIFQTNISQLNKSSWGNEFEIQPIAKVIISIYNTFKFITINHHIKFPTN